MAGGLARRSGVLVIRVWHDDGAAEGEFRARIIRLAESDGAESVEEVVASHAEVLAAVSRWLDGLRALPD
jgi:hypothetical protein